METNIKIKIPRGLATAIRNHNGYIRVMSTFCRLKAIESSSRINNYRKKLEEIADFCFISSRTLDTRISEMKLAGFAKKEGKDLILVGWDFIWTKFQIPFKSKSYWYYENEKMEYKLEYKFQQLAIIETQRSMASAYKLRVQGNPDYEYQLKSILGVHNRPVTAQDHLAGVIQAFTKGGFTEMQECMLMHRKYNPDNQISTEYMRKKFGYGEKSSSGPCYRKKILMKLGIIQIEKRVYESPERTRAANSGTVNYGRKSKKTFLRLCDRITAAN